MIISPPYIKFKKRVVNTIVGRCILYVLVAFFCTVASRYETSAIITAIVILFLFVSMMYFNSYKLNKYYLTSFEIDRPNGVIRFKVNKFDEFDYEKEIPITGCTLEYSELGNHIKLMHQLDVLIAYKSVFSQPEVGNWTEENLKSVIQNFKIK